MPLEEVGYDARIKNIEKYLGDLKRMDSSHKQLAQGMGVLPPAAERAVGSIGKLSAALGGIGLAVAGIQQMVGIFSKMGGFATQIGFAASRVSELGFALDAVAKSNNLTTDAVNETVQALRDANIAHEKALSITSLFVQTELDLADATKLATVAKDLAVISAQDSSAALVTMTEAISGQNVMMLRQFGIITTSTQIFEQYARTIDKVASELTEAERKQAFVNKILEAGTKAAGAYDAAMLSAGKQYRSLIGRVIPDFLALIGKGVEPVLAVVVKAIATTFKEMTKWVQDNEKVLIEYGTKVGEVFNTVITEGKAALALLVTAGESLSELNLGNLAESLSLIAGPILTLAAALGEDLVLVIQSIVAALVDLSNAVTPALAAGAEAFAIAIEGIAAAIQPLAHFLAEHESIVRAMVAVWIAFKAIAIASALAGMVNSIVMATQAILGQVFAMTTLRVASLQGRVAMTGFITTQRALQASSVATSAALANMIPVIGQIVAIITIAVGAFLIMSRGSKTVEAALTDAGLTSQDFANVFQEAMQRVQDSADRTGAGVEAMAIAMTEALAEAAGTMIPDLDALYEAVLRVQEAAAGDQTPAALGDVGFLVPNPVFLIEKITDALNTGATATEEYEEAMSNMVTELVKAGVAAKMSDAQFAAMVVEIASYSDSTAVMNDIITQSGVAWNENTDRVESMNKALAEAEDQVEATGEMTAQMMKKMTAAVKGLLPAVKETFEEWAQRLTDLADMYKTMPDTLTSISALLNDKTGGMAREAVKTFMGVLEAEGPEAVRNFGYILGTAPAEEVDRILQEILPMVMAAAAGTAGDALVENAPVQAAAFAALLTGEAFNESLLATLDEFSGTEAEEAIISKMYALIHPARVAAARVGVAFREQLIAEMQATMQALMASTGGKAATDPALQDMWKGVGNTLTAILGVSVPVPDLPTTGVPDRSGGGGGGGGGRGSSAGGGTTAKPPSPADIMKDAAAVANAVSSAISNAIDAFEKLEDFDKGAVRMDKLADLADSIRDAILEFGRGINEATVETAVLVGEWASAASSIVGVIGTGVASFDALKDYKGLVKARLTEFVDDYVWAANHFIAKIGDRGVKIEQSAVAYAESSGAVLAVIGGAVANLTSLDAYGKLARDIFKQFVDDVIWAANYFAKRIGENKIEDAAVEWAQAAGVVVSIIGSGVSNFLALDQYSPLVRSTLRAFVDDYIWAADYFAREIDIKSTEITSAATKFAESANQVLAVVSGGVSAFASLDDFGGLVRAVLVRFIDDFIWAVDQFAEAINDRTIEQTITDWADSVGSIVATIGEGVANFNALADYGPLIRADMERFVDDLVATIDYFQVASVDLDAELQEAAGRVASSAMAILGAIGAAAETFNLAFGVGLALKETIRAVVGLLVSAIGYFQSQIFFFDRKTLESTEILARAGGALVSALAGISEIFSDGFRITERGARRMREIGYILVNMIQYFAYSMSTFSLKVAEVTVILSETASNLTSAFVAMQGDMRKVNAAPLFNFLGQLLTGFERVIERVKRLRADGADAEMAFINTLVGWIRTIIGGFGIRFEQPLPPPTVAPPPEPEPPQPPPPLLPVLPPMLPEELQALIDAVFGGLVDAVMGFTVGDAQLDAMLKKADLFATLARAFRDIMDSMKNQEAIDTTGFFNTLDAILAALLQFMQDIGDLGGSMLGLGAIFTGIAGILGNIDALERLASLDNFTVKQAAVNLGDFVAETLKAMMLAMEGVDFTSLRDLTAALSAIAEFLVSLGTVSAPGYIPDFATGLWEASTDMLAGIHKGEMVMPATLASGIRDLFALPSPAASSYTTSVGDINLYFTGSPDREEVRLGVRDGFADVGLSMQMRNEGRLSH